ncbi:tol-pal system protein YbgF [Bartonella sp. LJL80]
MHMGKSTKLVTRSFKTTLMATVLLPALTLSAMTPAHSASGDQGGSALLGGLFPFGKKKEPESQNVQLTQSPDTRVTDLQQQVRELTGKVEELNFMVLQMQEQIRQLQAGSGGSAGEPSKPAVQPPAAVENNGRQGFPPPPSDNSHLPGVEIGKQSNANQTVPSEAPKDLGSIRFDENGNILNGNLNPDAIQPTPQGGNALADVPQTASAKELYDIGYRNILAGDYRAAESVFRAFQERYPSDPLIADASFWLGEALFGQNRYREAAQAYIDVQRNYKDSPRGPENLLKLGMSMSHLDEQKVACATFAEVTKRYKTVEPAVLKRVKDEQSRNKCQ